MMTNLVMLWYCSVSTESTFLFVVGTGIVTAVRRLIIGSLCLTYTERDLPHLKAIAQFLTLQRTLKHLTLKFDGVSAV